MERNLNQAYAKNGVVGLRALAVLAAPLVLCTGCLRFFIEDPPAESPTPRGAPSIAAIQPLAAFAGDVVELVGDGFDANPASNQVAFAGGRTAAVHRVDGSTRAWVTVPEDAQSGPLLLANQWGRSEPGPVFTYRGLGEPRGLQQVLRIDAVHAPRSVAVVAQQGTAWGFTVSSRGAFVTRVGIPPGDYDFQPRQALVDWVAAPLDRSALTVVTRHMDGTFAVVPDATTSSTAVSLPGDFQAHAVLSRRGVNGVEAVVLGAVQAGTPDLAVALVTTQQTQMVPLNLPRATAHGMCALGGDQLVFTVDEPLPFGATADRVYLLDVASGARTRLADGLFDGNRYGRCASALLGGGSHALALIADRGVALRTVQGTTTSSPRMLNLAGDSLLSDVAAVAVTGGVMVVVSRPAEGQVVAFDFDSGAVRWSARVGSQPDLLAVDAVEARIWVTDRIENRLTVLDAATGADVGRQELGAPLGVLGRPLLGATLAPTGEDEVWTFDWLGAYAVSTRQDNVRPVTELRAAVRPLGMVAGPDHTLWVAGAPAEVTPGVDPVTPQGWSLQLLSPEVTAVAFLPDGTPLEGTYSSLRVMGGPTLFTRDLFDPCDLNPQPAGAAGLFVDHRGGAVACGCWNGVKRIARWPAATLASTSATPCGETLVDVSPVACLATPHGEWLVGDVDGRAVVWTSAGEATPDDADCEPPRRMLETLDLGTPTAVVRSPNGRLALWVEDTSTATGAASLLTLLRFTAPVDGGPPGNGATRLAQVALPAAVTGVVFSGNGEKLYVVTAGDGVWVLE